MLGLTVFQCLAIIILDISNYNSRYKPKEVFWIGGEGHLIRREEKFDDLIRNQVDLRSEVLQVSK